jgi:hypothetical protein
VTVTSREDAVGIIHNCAVLYSKNLSGNSILFIASDNNKAACFEALFLPRNFLHLTGVKTSLDSESFFNSALNQRLSPKEITYAPSGLTELKLEILPQLMSIHLNARMIGDYDNSRPLLIADKFAGTVTMAMGFTRVNDLYIPNTALKIDIRDITANSTRRKVIAVFSKPRANEFYKRLTYIAKGVMIDDNIFKPILSEKVDTQNMTAMFPIPRKNESEP